MICIDSRYEHSINFMKCMEYLTFFFEYIIGLHVLIRWGMFQSIQFLKNEMLIRNYSGAQKKIKMTRFMK